MFANLLAIMMTVSSAAALAELDDSSDDDDEEPMYEDEKDLKKLPNAIEVYPGVTDNDSSGLQSHEEWEKKLKRWLTMNSMSYLLRADRHWGQPQSRLTETMPEKPDQDSYMREQADEEDDRAYNEFLETQTTKYDADKKSYKNAVKQYKLTHGALLKTEQARITMAGYKQTVMCNALKQAVENYKPFHEKVSLVDDNDPRCGTKAFQEIERAVYKLRDDQGSEDVINKLVTQITVIPPMGDSTDVKNFCSSYKTLYDRWTGAFATKMSKQSPEPWRARMADETITELIHIQLPDDMSWRTWIDNNHDNEKHGVMGYLKALNRKAERDVDHMESRIANPIVQSMLWMGTQYGSNRTGAGAGAGAGAGTGLGVGVGRGVGAPIGRFEVLATGGVVGSAAAASEEGR